ncbi:hypothetical protein ACLOJK_033941 [Asimina triloba]
MDIEQKQAELIDHFLNRAETLRDGSLCTVIVEATSHPSLFAFSEILSVPNVSEGLQYYTKLNATVMRGLEDVVCFDDSAGIALSWAGNAGCLPQLVPDQVRKLKQLTVLTLAETNKRLEFLYAVYKNM